MLAVLRWTFWSMILLIVVGFLHYTLPQTDIVRIINTYEERQDFGENSIFWAKANTGNDPTVTNRDVFFIQTRRAKGDVMVYRNEDTGWGWPPYFKFDTANLQAEAADAVSSGETARWFAMKHYGWRNEFLTVYPNAISLRPVAGPDAAKGVPWLNIVIITILVAIVWAIWVRWRRFRRARIDPTIEAIEDDLSEKSSAVTRWIGSWRKKS